MNARSFLRKAWHDTVWSKVIATGITAALTVIFGASLSYWETLSGLRVSIAHLASASVLVPAWFLVLLGLLIIGLLLLSFRRRKNETPNDDDVQPNAVPVTNVRVVDIQ